MSNASPSERLGTGVPNLDLILDGGLLRGSVTVLAGTPGAGKTILAQQICFHNAAPDARVLYFNTLSEPTAKTLRYLRAFRYFDPEKLRTSVEFIDLGDVLRRGALPEASRFIVEQLQRVSPAIVVIDSFKVVDDLTRSASELRHFSYEICVNLMAWECTTLLLGEYGPGDFETNPLFSIVDGLITATQREHSGEQQRFFRVVKMRGTDQDRDEHPFAITAEGISVFAPRVTLRREATTTASAHPPPRIATGLSKLDELLGDGIPRGSSVLVSGAPGTGKTVLALEYVYRGAERFGEKGLFVSFEEPVEQLLTAARGLGLDLDAQVARGLVELVHVPQPEISLERDVQLIRDRLAATKATRVAIDSVSVFLHRVREPQLAREKVYQLSSLVQNHGAVGLFTMDVPFGTDKISRFGVEETVVDGVIRLSANEEGLERQRYLEVYKMRNTSHLTGLHNFAIGQGGISVFPRYNAADFGAMELPPMDRTKRLPSGVAGLDALLGGGLLERSITLLSGSTGIGKSTFAMHFALEAPRAGETAVYVSLEEGSEQVLASADSLGLPLRDAVRDGRVSIIYLSQQRVRTAQFLSILTDAIRQSGARRVVIDGTSHLQNERLKSDQLRELLGLLSARFKVLGATSLFTVEAPSLFATDFVTDRYLSPISDNLLMLRYLATAARLERTVTIVKTRGAAHADGTYGFTLGDGGVTVGARVPTPATGQDPPGAEQP